MSYKDLTAPQVEALTLIRQRRREIAHETAEEHRALMGIVNAAATRRSEKRHRFMLLAGGIVGVSAPLLLQGQAAFVNIDLVRAGSVCLLITIAVGAVFDAIDERRTTPVLLRGSASLAKASALALAEDIKLVSAGVGDTGPDLDEVEKRARHAAEQADADLRRAGDQFVNVAALETALFFGSFVLGVMLFVCAVGTAAPRAG